MREVSNEPIVEVGEADEILDFLLAGWGQPFRHSSNLGWVHLYQVVKHNHTKVLYPGLLNFTFIRFQEELVLLQECQDLAGDLPVLL